MKKLINKLITRENVAELCRLVEGIKLERMAMINDEDMPKTVIEYNSDLMKLDENILKILIDIKKELKKRC